MASDVELKQAASDYLSSYEEINKINEEIKKLNSSLLQERNKQDRAEKILFQCVGASITQRTFKVSEYQAVHVSFNDEGNSKYVELLELE